MGSCHNCKHLDHIIDTDSDGYETSGTGFVCDKQYAKEAVKGKEDQFTERLQREAYRLKSKRCFEVKNAKQPNGNDSIAATNI